MCRFLLLIELCKWREIRDSTSSWAVDASTFLLFYVVCVNTHHMIEQLRQLVVVIVSYKTSAVTTPLQSAVPRERLQTVFLNCLSLHLSLCVFSLRRVSGAPCDWAVGGCKESQPQRRWAGLSQGSSSITSTRFFLDSSSFTDMFLDKTYCIIRELQPDS